MHEFHYCSVWDFPGAELAGGSIARVENVIADQFLAEVRIFPFNFAPRGWAFCNGQILSISQNTALFALLGTFYGGDGRSNFALPNLQGCAVVQAGQGPGLSDRVLGETSGSQTVTLLQSELPAHSHNLLATSAGADDNTPEGNVFARPSPDLYAVDTSPVTPMAPTALPIAGGSQPHNNMQPYLTLNFCIALQGIFPPRS
jgi:microcystin-dependent protein